MTNTFVIIALLFGIEKANGASLPENSAAQDYIKTIDTDKINKDVVNNLTQEVLTMNIKSIIDKEV